MKNQIKMSFELSVCTTFFDLCGLLTEYTCTTSYRRFAYSMLILHYALAFFFTFFMGCILTYLLRFVTMLDAINEMSQYLCLISTYWICLIESHVKRKTQRKFWEIFARLNKSGRTCASPIYLLEYFVSSIAIMIAHMNQINIPPDILLPYFILYCSSPHILSNILCETTKD